VKDARDKIGAKKKNDINLKKKGKKERKKKKERREDIVR
jgi:hypothetical protein